MELISVVVVSYNSEDTIEDVLNSVYEQTYPNVELILADDCSQDHTLTVAEKWCKEKNADARFSAINMYSNEKNLGTSQNLNEACKRSNGEWIKIIGGDDMLFKDCLEAYINYAHERNEEALYMSDTVDFWKKNGEMICRPYTANENASYLRKFNTSSAYKQWQMVLRDYLVAAPTFFFSRGLWERVDGFDTRYGLMEDWPFIIRCTKNGECLRYLERATVYYRIGDPGTTKAEHFYSPDHLKRIQRLKRDEMYPNVSKWHVFYYFNEMMTDFMWWFTIHVLNNEMTKRNVWIHYLLSWTIPRTWRQKIVRLKSHKIFGLIKERDWSLDRKEENNG